MYIDRNGSVVSFSSCSAYWTRCHVKATVVVRIPSVNQFARAFDDARGHRIVDAYVQMVDTTSFFANLPCVLGLGFSGVYTRGLNDVTCTLH